MPVQRLSTLPSRTGTFVTHCSGGEHGTDPEEMRAFVAAFNDPSIWMDGYDLHTNRIHTNRIPFDLSDFWKEWDNREKA